ncbi:hypothetical protein N9062_03835 [Akkermansiaceae bacterium]|nr:hypothetical protein [Akkermansiaceae bacterium]MDA7933945.1 hypothetical protein [Akkermansiaceae bacterium]MDA8976415.1 hypothetical protein [bacterium]MDB4510116.1 hypothetical protein [Akkermansiaceae bacterium]
MSEQETQVQKLIRLKRFEQPRDGYFEDFLKEFQSRRDGEVASRPSTFSAASRVADLFRGMTSGKWVVGAGVAYAALLVIVLSWPKGPEARPDASRQPIIFEPKQPIKKPVNPPKNTVPNPVPKPGP